MAGPHQNCHQHLPAQMEQGPTEPHAYCVLRVLSVAWALRCMTFLFCVEEADWVMAMGV